METLFFRKYKGYAILWGFGFAEFLLYSCSSVAPVASNFESASTIEQGAIELHGNYSRYLVNGIDNSSTLNSSNSNIGFRIGYGIFERNEGILNGVDLKFRYEMISPLLDSDRELFKRRNYMALTPKFSFLNQRIAFSLTSGIYSNTQEEAQISEEVIFSFRPCIYYTPFSPRYFDATLSASYEFQSISMNQCYGVNLGIGISNNKEKWCIRPEVGLVKSIGFIDNVWYWGGIAANINLNFSKK